MKKVLEIAKILILVLIASLGLSYVSAWSGPPAGGPFNCPESHVGCAGPLHVGAATQTKTGALTVNGNLWGGNIFTAGTGYFGGKVGIGKTAPATELDVNGTIQTLGFKIPTGAATGRVLTSDASGNATWQTPATGGTGGGDGVIIPTNAAGFIGRNQTANLQTDWDVIFISGQFTAGDEGGDAAGAGGFIYRTGAESAYAALHSGQTVYNNGGVGTSNFCSGTGNYSLCVRFSGRDLLITTGTEVQVTYLKLQ